MPNLNYSAALLAGGMSRRMGQDKAMLPWQGVPLWKLQLNKLLKLSPAPSSLLLSCRQDQPFPTNHFIRIHDPMADQGPLPAIQRCLDATSSPLLVLAVDLPKIPIHFLQLLLDLHFQHPHQGIMACDANEFFEPLCAIYPQTIQDLIPQHQRLQTLAKQAVEQGLIQTLRLTQEQQSYFFNVNTPEDL